MPRQTANQQRLYENEPSQNIPWESSREDSSSPARCAARMLRQQQSSICGPVHIKTGKPFSKNFPAYKPNAGKGT